MPSAETFRADNGAVAAGRPRRGSAAAKLIERLPGRQEVSLAEAIALTGHSRESVRRAINRLEAAGLLRETTGRQRGRRWVWIPPSPALSGARKPRLRSRARTAVAA